MGCHLAQALRGELSPGLELMALFLGPQPICSATSRRPVLSSVCGVGASYLDSTMTDNLQTSIFWRRVADDTGGGGSAHKALG